MTLLTEFDRTPKINGNAGRDHWPRTNSVLMGGGLIKGGQVYGSTNEMGDAIKDNPVNMNDLFATYFAALGIKPDTTVRDNLGRPARSRATRPRSSANWSANFVFRCSWRRRVSPTLASREITLSDLPRRIGRVGGVFGTHHLSPSRMVGSEDSTHPTKLPCQRLR